MAKTGINATGCIVARGRCEPPQEDPPSQVCFAHLAGQEVGCAAEDDKKG